MRRVVATLLAAVIVLAASACGTTGGPAAGRLSVVAAFYPLQFVADRVGGDRVSVTNLAPPGAEPHDLELNPRQVAQIADADLVVYLKGFQPTVDEAVDQQARTSVDVATMVPLLGGAADPDQAGAAEGADPHVWLDPTRLATIGIRLAEQFAEQDPDGAAGYQIRARQLTSDLDALDREFSNGLTTCQRREIVVSHAAFGYLADRYDLRQIPITGLSPEVEPSPQELAAAADRAREHAATTIFFETLVSPRVAEAVATAIGAQTAVLDPIEGLEPGSGGDYVSVMRTNLATLRPALGCA